MKFFLILSILALSLSCKTAKDKSSPLNYQTSSSSGPCGASYEGHTEEAYKNGVKFTYTHYYAFKQSCSEAPNHSACYDFCKFEMGSAWIATKTRWKEESRSGIRLDESDDAEPYCVCANDYGFLWKDKKLNELEPIETEDYEEK